MGKRSINTTKSGIFMNPADKVRKEARKKELKKNKKQRQMVRAAVLKGKNPHHLIQDMEKIDRMEFDVNNPPQLNERVLREKRKKLRETFAGVLNLYEKEDPEQYKHMRRLEFNYENRRTELIQYYESVKYAQQVQIEDIPLPSTQMLLTSTAISQIPLAGETPLPLIQPPHSILKASTYDNRPYISAPAWIRPRVPTGVPPGPPPPFSDDESEDEVDGNQPSALPPLLPPSHLPPGLPPILKPGFTPLVRLSPGPPSSGTLHEVVRPSTAQPSSSSPNVVSAPPSLINRCKAEDGHKGVTTIEGKPQLKNLRAEITQFMPTSLRVKREDRGKKRDHKSSTGFAADELGQSMMKAQSRHMPTKDDAYEQFLKEMEDLM